MDRFQGQEARVVFYARASSSGDGARAPARLTLTRPDDPHEAQIVIETFELLAGELPARAIRLVKEWAAIHRAELEANWAKAEAHVPLDTIEPLP